MDSKPVLQSSTPPPWWELPENFLADDVATIQSGFSVLPWDSDKVMNWLGRAEARWVQRDPVSYPPPWKSTRDMPEAAIRGLAHLYRREMLIVNLKSLLIHYPWNSPRVQRWLRAGEGKWLETNPKSRLPPWEQLEDMPIASLSALLYVLKKSKQDAKKKD